MLQLVALLCMRSSHWEFKSMHNIWYIVTNHQWIAQNSNRTTATAPHSIYFNGIKLNKHHICYICMEILFYLHLSFSLLRLSISFHIKFTIYDFECINTATFTICTDQNKPVMVDWNSIQLTQMTCISFCFLSIHEPPHCAKNCPDTMYTSSREVPWTHVLNTGDSYYKIIFCYKNFLKIKYQKLTS